MLALASMQNAGYLVLPIGAAIYPDQFDEFALYVSLFILGFNPILWSVGKLLATDRRREGIDWRGLLNPPLVSCLSAIFLVLSGIAAWIPDSVLETVRLMGDGAVPTATVVLGAMLGGMKLSLRPHLWDATRVVLVKFCLLPALTVMLLAASSLAAGNPLMARFLVLEAGSRGRVRPRRRPHPPGPRLWRRRAESRQCHARQLPRLHSRPADLALPVGAHRGLKQARRSACGERAGRGRLGSPDRADTAIVG
jgi:hypothetical protein